MSFIEKQSHGGHIYYYLVKSVRTANGKVKKYRISLGRTIPNKARLNVILKELDKKASRQHSAGWLPTDLIDKIEDLRSSIIIFKKLPDDILPKDFLVRFTYNTNAIEGNALTLRQTALVLIDKATPEGARANDVIEALNSADAWKFVKSYNGQLGRPFLCKVQYLITKDTTCRIQGSYRDNQVKINGSEWTPPQASEVPNMLNGVFANYPEKRRSLHPVELAAWLHNKVAQIHPFSDGNGRTARLLMNWVLIKNKLPPVIIEVRNKERYYAAIEASDTGDEAPFTKFLASQMLEQYTKMGSQA